MALAEEIRRKLETHFTIRHLEVHDNSESHRGHAGFREGGESHWRIVISAKEFEDMSRIARHRAIHSALGAGITGKVHALQIMASG